jgi:[ribosomal protein S5]-alanine N-acetyltransferase
VAVPPLIVDTARLRLRPQALADVDAHHAAIGSDAGVPWDHRVRTREQTEEVVRRRVAHWEEHGFGLWAVEWRESGEYLGEAGLQHFEGGEPVEVGYYLGRSAWGRGVATEAGEAALRHGFEALDLDTIVAVVRPENEGSKRVLTKLGLRFRRHGDHYGFADTEVWDLGRDAWAERVSRSG